MSSHDNIDYLTGNYDDFLHALSFKPLCSAFMFKSCLLDNFTRSVGSNFNIETGPYR